MRRTIRISIGLLRNWIRSRSGVFFSILFPVMLLLIFATIFGGEDVSRYEVYVQNLDRTSEGEPTNLSQTFVDVLNQTEVLAMNQVPHDVDARGYVEGQLGGFGASFRLLVIPEGFHNALINGTQSSRLDIVGTTLESFLQEAGTAIPPEQKIVMQLGLAQIDALKEGLSAGNATLLYVADETNQASGIALSIIHNIASAFNYGMIGAELAIALEQESVIETELEVVDFYLPGLIGAFIMTNGIIGVTTNTTEFKRRGILRRFATTPLRRVEWVMGNILTQTLLSFLLVLVMLAVGWVAFGVRALPNPMTAILVIAGASLFSGIGLILAGALTDVEAASAAGNAIAFPMMFLSGSFFPLEFMPGFLQTIAKFLPLTYLSEGLRSALVTHHMPSAVSNLAIVAGLSVIFILLGSAVTRWHEK